MILTWVMARNVLKKTRIVVDLKKENNDVHEENDDMSETLNGG